MNPAKKPALLGAVIGAVVAAVIMYVYLNTATSEVLAARADGIPLWSWYQVPFVVPEALLGGLLGAALGFVVRRLRALHGRCQ